MIIEKNLSNFTVKSFASIKEALSILEKNHRGFIIIVDENYCVEGVLTDGDYRRASLIVEAIDLTSQVFNICNKNYTVMSIESDILDIEQAFSDKTRFIPLIDKCKRLSGIAVNKEPTINIGSFQISNISPTFIIAEIGLNHNGSLKVAYEMIQLAAKAGVDCVKFQMRDLSQLYRNGGILEDIEEDLGSQYVLDLLNKYNLSNDEMFLAFDYCKQFNIIPLCTPWDLVSLAALEKYGMVAYKVASADFTNHDFLITLARTGKTLICSTGMSTETEILKSVQILNKYNARYILLHCNSTYPPPFKDINLNYLQTLKKISNNFVGYSGHERGYHIPVAAVALGAKVIEKHFTLDKSQEGNDHKISLLPVEMKEMVKNIRSLELSLGSANYRNPSQGELMNRNTLAKSLVASQKIVSGEIIDSNKIKICAPGKGLQPNYKDQLIGTTAKRNFNIGDYFYASDLHDTEYSNQRKFNFNRPFGIPVRFHDYKALTKDTNIDFIEFHLSYNDLNYDIESNLTQDDKLDLIVHCPDVFEGDFLLDLSSIDTNHRSRSIKELQRCINFTRRLKKYYPKTKRPLLVVSLGGVSYEGMISEKERNERYQLLSQSLRQLDSEEVEIIGQTLPPYPWYFGGQLFLNLFVFADDTVQFCRDNNIRLCFDISHSKLACNQFKLSFTDFVDKVGPYAAHLHIADAVGVDGEGLQINEGEIDFWDLCRRLKKVCPSASFIPEIWQGHKDNGNEFRLALTRLEKYFS